MAYSQLEDRYLNSLAELQFPTAMPQDVVTDPSLEGMQLAAGPSDTRTDAGPRFGRGGVTQAQSQAAGGLEKPLTALADTAAGFTREAAIAAGGVFGDLESLKNAAIAVFNGPEDKGLLDRFLLGLEQKTNMATSEQISKEGFRIPFTDKQITIPPAIPSGVSDQKNREHNANVGGSFGKIAPLPGLIDAGIAGAKAGIKATKGMPVGLSIQPVGDIPTGSVPLTRTERSVVTNAAGRKPALRQSATKAIEDMHANYPENKGWMPIEASKVNFKNSKTGQTIAEVEAAKIPYDFHTPPEGVPKDAWQATLAARVFDEVQTVVDRAKAGDQAAIAIIEQANWYRSMRDRLRAEFGGIGDVFADVLGTTSAQTGVEQNFDNAVEILRRFSRGEYDNELRAYEDRLKSGLSVDSKTLTQMYKDGEFPLITKASGQLFNANSPPSMGALLDLFRAVKVGDSPKTPNFTGNLIGLTNEATIDVWAARMLRRIADLPRIPPPAEKGVAGKHLVGSTLYNPKVGSEFGFGQDVFREAADEINKSGIIKSVAPQIGDLGPDDLQAVAWFIEKEKWTNNGWTTKAGEGGSLDYEMSLAGAADPQAIKDLRRDINKGFKAPEQRKTETDEQYASRVQEAKDAFDSGKVSKQQQLANMGADVDRFTLGVSGERPNRPMSNYAQAELAAEFDDVVRDDASVVTYNLANTYGSFMAQTERALNAEFVTRQGFNPASLERRLVEQGKAYDQDAVFMSKVLKNGTSPNARPGVEIYFKQKITPQQMEMVTQKLREYGVDGFTYVTDMRFNDRINVQARAGGADTAGLNGIRFQYIPEFDDAYNAANRAQIMAEKQKLFRSIVDDIIMNGNVSDARLTYYDTKVFFRSDYDAYLARTTGRTDQGTRGVQPTGTNASQSDNGRAVGEKLPGTVSDRVSRKKGILSDQSINRGRGAPKSGAQ